ncbi:MAG: hypothetical protein ACK5WO_05155 [Cyclobacteriaceae bacterium]|jgi:hypothetical protein|nr:hypothetical protein [Flammeovirgaceae bacterium]
MKYFLTFCLFLPLLIGCQDDPEPVIQLLVNGDMETGAASPNSWWNREQTVYSTEWTTEEASKGSKSLKISASQTDPINFAFWAQTFSGSIPVEKNVVLSVSVKGKDLTGQGVSIVIRGDAESSPGGPAEQGSTTQGTTNITGTFDWTTYTVRLTGIERDIKSLTIYLILLPNSTGEVYFDEASLIVE